MNVLRLRVTDDMPMAARVLVWPRDQGGYFIYVRPGTPRGSVRSALRGLKDTSAVHRELTVIAFAAKDAWRSPRERVMSFGAGLATTVVASGLATSVAVPELAVAPVVHHHGKSFLPSWADLDPGAGRAGKAEPSASRHPGRSPSVTPSRLPQPHSGTPGSVGLPSPASAARGHLAPDTPTKDAATKDAPTKDAPTKDAPTKDAPTKDAATKDAATKAAKNEVKKAAKPSKPVTVKPAKQVKASAPKPVKPAQPSKPSDHAGKR